MKHNNFETSIVRVGISRTEYKIFIQLCNEINKHPKFLT